MRPSRTRNATLFCRPRRSIMGGDESGKTPGRFVKFFDISQDSDTLVRNCGVERNTQEPKTAQVAIDERNMGAAWSDVIILTGHRSTFFLLLSPSSHFGIRAVAPLPSTNIVQGVSCNNGSDCLVLARMKCKQIVYILREQEVRSSPHPSLFSVAFPLRPFGNPHHSSIQAVSEGHGAQSYQTHTPNRNHKRQRQVISPPRPGGFPPTY